MTRNEAISKIFNYIKNPNDLLCCLEKLGLIKFDEEKVVDSSSMIIKNVLQDYTYAGTSNIQLADKIIGSLMSSGYKIVTKRYLDDLNKMVDEK